MVIAKREFIQHTSKYLKEAEQEDIIITHHGTPALALKPIKKKLNVSDLANSMQIQILEDDINTPILDEFEL